MFRLWGKEFKDNHMIKDTTICDDSGDTRTHKIFNALDEICYEFDLSKPIWLDVNINEFKRHSKARFYQDSFVDSIDFDFLEIQVIEKERIFQPHEKSSLLLSLRFIRINSTGKISLSTVRQNYNQILPCIFSSLCHLDRCPERCS